MASASIYQPKMSITDIRFTLSVITFPVAALHRRSDRAPISLTYLSVEFLLGPPPACWLRWHRPIVLGGWIPATIGPAGSDHCPADSQADHGPGATPFWPFIACCRSQRSTG